MIIPFNTYIQDGLGPFAPQAAVFEWPSGTHVILRGTHHHSDGSIYDLSGAVALLMSFKQRESDALALVAREATITDPSNGIYEIEVTDADGGILVPNPYTTDVIFSDNTGPTEKRDEVLLPSRVNVTRSIVVPGQPVSVPPSTTPLAQGPPGLQHKGNWSSLVTYNVRDAVQYPDLNGGGSNALSTFFAKVVNTNVPPLNGFGALSSSWSYLAERGADGATGPAGAAGVPGLNPLGTWSNVTAYVPRDSVTYPDPNGGASNALSSFRCVTGNTNIPPLGGLGGLVLDSHWAYVAQRGSDGTAGVSVPVPPARRCRFVFKGSGTAGYWQLYENIEVTFTGSGDTVAASWPDMLSVPFRIIVGAVKVPANSGGVTAQVESGSISTTGCNIQISAPVACTVDLIIEEVI